MDLIFQKDVLRFASSRLDCSFKAQEDGKRDHFGIQKDNTSKQETLQHDKNLSDIRISQVSILKR